MPYLGIDEALAVVALREMKVVEVHYSRVHDDPSHNGNDDKFQEEPYRRPYRPTPDPSL